ncbi:MAG: hypothetical protein Q9223_003550 [Gallowayella weberi]
MSTASSVPLLLGYFIQQVNGPDETSDDELGGSFAEQGFQIVFPFPTISNVHLRLYSIRYDPGVEPFVYAENLSLNGVDWLHWCGTSSVKFPVPRGQAVLLSSGDKLCLCDQTRERDRNPQILFTFQTRLPASELLTSTQMEEQRDPDCRQVLEKAVSAG